MLSFLKRRAFWAVVGLILAAILVLLFGPMIAFGPWRPMDSLAGQLVAIAAIFTWYGAWTLLKRARANRAGQQLAAAVVKQPDAERPSADVVQLRERFEEAIGALKQNKRGAQNLYELPWYVIIGAPGSGKTTALVNSGLHFPLEQRSGKGALRGVGGTRNCDWWFTEEAVLLDTAGRYTTQDSDAAADSAGWLEFLALLKKYRKRRPVNGVLLAISAHDLMVQGQAGREAHVAAARRRLNELNKELKIQLPVYVLVTKCDLVAGFTEFFDNLTQEERAQVWGVTFPREQTEQGTAAGLYAAEFDALVQRLNERVLARLEDDHDVHRRAKVFGFPQQMAALRESLTAFVADVFEATRFDQRVLLRGVYFTSGTQEGTPIDRLLGALGRRFSMPDAVAPASGRGRAYFISRLLKDVVLAESGLAGVNRKVELQKAAAQLGAYAALVLGGVLGLFLLWYSYSTNRQFLTEYTGHTTKVAGAVATGDASPAAVLPRLDRVRGLVDRAEAYSRDVSWLRRGWGLNQGPWVEESAADLYKSELSRALLDTAKTRIELRLQEFLSRRDAVGMYEYLRAYLMLEDPDRFDRAQVEKVANLEWRAAYSADPKSAERLSAHFSKLLEYQPPGIQTDKELIARVREAIPAEAVPALIYSQIKLEFDKKNLEQPPLGSFFGGKVFRNAADAQFVPGMFTKAGFDAMAEVIDDADERFEQEIWVWGDAAPGRLTTEGRRSQIWSLYESEYIREWDAMLGGLGIVTPTSREAAIDLVRAIGAEGPNSALKQLLLVVRTHTLLAASLTQPKPEGMLGTLRSTFAEWDRSIRAWAETHGEEPGARVTIHFKDIHALLQEVGGAAPIDKLLELARELGKKLESTGGDRVGGDGSAAGVEGLSQTAEGLKREAGEMKGPAAGIGSVLSELGGSAVRVSRGDLSKSLNEKVAAVFDECRLAINGRYPFVQSSREDVTIADFTRVFGPSGVFDTFIRNELSQVASVIGNRIDWKSLSTGDDAAGLGGGTRARLRDALLIQDVFFGGGQAKAGYFVVVSDAGPSERVVRFELTLDGEKRTFRFDPQKPLERGWPGPLPGEAAAVFVERSGRQVPIVERGAWAIFRLIDAGAVSTQSQNRFKLRLTRDGMFADLDFEVNSVKNPFGRLSLLQNFSCGR
jgi:type VI secretion system protein ImpL